MSRNYNEYERNNRSYIAKKKPFPILVIFIPAAALFITAAVLSLMTYSSYLYADREYNNLISSYLHPIASNGEPVPLTSSPDTAKPEGCSQYPELRIDFEGLLKINPNFVCWIYIPGCDISYPIVKGTDNEGYLHTTFEGNNSKSGCLFMDYRDNEDFSLFNTFIYGHNMKNGSMFGKLKKYYNDKSCNLLKQQPYIYIYQKDGIVHRYQIFSLYTADGNASTYTIQSEDASEEMYLKYVADQSEIKTGVDTTYVAGSSKVITLSTCYGQAGSGTRLLVHGILCDK